MTRLPARRLDIAQLGSHQNAREQRDGKRYAQGQRAEHLLAAQGIVSLAVTAAITFAHHEEQGASQAGQNGQKSENDDEFHEVDYLVRCSPIPDLWRFVLITVAAVAAAALTASLGLWQLDRAAQKQTLADAIGRQQVLAPWHEAQLAAQVPAAIQALTAQQMQQLLHRPVQLQGRWLADETIYLDNRQMQGKVGFFVLTPLQLSAPHEDVVIVVQRGWVPRNFMDRMALPPVQTPEAVVTIEGRLEAAPSKLMELDNARSPVGTQAGADPDGQKSRIRQNADIPAWAQQSGLPLLGLSVLQTGSDVAASDGLLRDWPVINAGVQKHYGYAFQWFGLCLLIVLLYVWFQLVRRFFLRRPASEPSPDAAAGTSDR